MIIVAIWLQVDLMRNIRAPHFTTFFWGACFHTFLAGNYTFTYTLYGYACMGACLGQYSTCTCSVPFLTGPWLKYVMYKTDRPLIMLSASSLYIHYIDI